MHIEKTEVWIGCKRAIDRDARAVRRFFGGDVMYRKFHGHMRDKC